jgi:PAS domain S-box-containing protein
MTKSTSQTQFDPAIGRKLLGIFSIALLIVAAMVVAAIQNNRRQSESAGWLDHSYAFIAEADGVVSSLSAAEAAQRTYVVTGDNAMRAGAVDAFAKAGEHLEVAQQLAFENPAQALRMNRVAGFLQRQIDSNKQSMQLRERGPAAALSIFTNVETQANLANIQREIRETRKDEMDFLQQREQKMQRHTWWTERIFFVGSAFIVVLLAAAGFLVGRDLRLRKRAAKVLKLANDALEEQVSLRTAELALALDKVQVKNIEQQWGQAALQRLVGQHELVLNAVRDSVLVVSRNGKIISSNAAAIDLTQREAEKLPGSSITDFVVEEKTQGTGNWKRHFLREPILKGERRERVSAYLKKPDGTALPVRVSCYPTRDSDSLSGAVVTIYSGLS